MLIGLVGSILQQKLRKTKDTGVQPPGEGTHTHPSCGPRTPPCRGTSADPCPPVPLPTLLAWPPGEEMGLSRTKGPSPREGQLTAHGLEACEWQKGQERADKIHGKSHDQISYTQRSPGHRPKRGQGPPTPNHSGKKPACPARARGLDRMPGPPRCSATSPGALALHTWLPRPHAATPQSPGTHRARPHARGGQGGHVKC